MARLKPVERRFAMFTQTPVSVRRAMAVIVAATVVSVIVGGVLIRLLDPAPLPISVPACGGRSRRSPLWATATWLRRTRTAGSSGR